MDVPFGKFRDKGKPIDNISNYTSAEERIVLVESMMNLRNSMVFMGSSDGMLKQVQGSEFDVAKRTTAATKLNDGASLKIVKIVTGMESVIMESEKGYCLRFQITRFRKRRNLPSAYGV